MAADLNPDWLSCLPSSWSYGVTRDGRVFFINEEAKSTTWLHPITGEAVVTGHRKTPDLPTGWEEGYTFEGARCFINHNERKVTCKHPVSGIPSQDNCIFVVNEHVNCGKLVHPVVNRPAQNAPTSTEKKERPTSTMSEASNYTGGSDYTTYAGSPVARQSRPSKKVHNFGKRSNSIRRNPNAPVVKSSWLYKQDSTGMKMWKKRWFVLSDMCLFYYKDDKEECILGSILLPSFHISLLSVDDHISRKYAFKATHPNMRTYYFSTDNAKDMESWMKVMTDAALVHTEPAITRLDKSKGDYRSPQEMNNMLNHRVLTRPEIQNNERNRDPSRSEEKKPKVLEKPGKQKEHSHRCTLQRDGDRYTLQKDGERYTLQKDGDRYSLQKDGERYCLQKEGEKYTLQKDSDRHALQKEEEMYALTKDAEQYALQKEADNYATHKEIEKYVLQKDGERHTLKKDSRYAVQKDGQVYALQKDGQLYALQKDGERLTLQKDTERYMVHKDAERHTLHKDSKRYALPKDTETYVSQKDIERYPLQKEGEKLVSPRDGERPGAQRDSERSYGYQREPSAEPARPVAKINSIKLQPEQAAAIAAAVSSSRQLQLQLQQQQQQQQQVAQQQQQQLQQPHKPAQHNGSGERSPLGDVALAQQQQPTRAPGQGQGQGPSQTHTQQQQPPPGHEPERNLQRTNSMQQLEQWVRAHPRVRPGEDDTRSITSYQTLPRNMPSHRAQVLPRYPEGYRTLPRNSGTARPGSVCGYPTSAYERGGSGSSSSGGGSGSHHHTLTTATASEKRRSMRDDTMWQLYEWQQRQVMSQRQAYATLPSPRTMADIAEHVAAAVPGARGSIAQSIPPSPSHASMGGGLYHTYSPRRSSHNHATRSELSSPIYRGDLSIDRRHRAHPNKYAYPTDRRSVPMGMPVQSITPQSLQGKTPEELTLLLIKLRRQQAELTSLREHALAQLMQLNLDADNPKSDILSHHLQRNLMYLDGQMKENEPLIFMIHTMIENSAPRPQLYQQLSPEDYRDGSYTYRPGELDVDTKLSRLCEQDKVVRTQEDKLQQLHREKHTLETALLSASQEIEMSADNPAAVQSVIQQRDVLQSGLLSTCRELTRVTTHCVLLCPQELERAWRDHDRLEADVTTAKTNLLERLEALGSPQTEPPSQQHVQIQKELWRIQDVMEALSKNKPQRSVDTSFPGTKSVINVHKNEEVDPVPPRPPLPHSYESSDCSPAVPPLAPSTGSGTGTSSSQGHLPRPLQHQRNGAQSGPDYRLYKSEPELTTVAEVDESNGEDKTAEQAVEKESASAKGMPYPVGIVPPRAKSPITESSSIASYVTLRKSKKPDSRTERPRSAVEQSGCGTLEGVRPRMSVEEQMERIRRHQQASLRRRDSSGGAQESSLSRSSSFNREQISINPYYTLQSSKRGDAVSPDRQRLEASLQALEQEMLERASAMLNTPSSQVPQPPKPPAQEVLATEERMNSPPVEQSSPKVEEKQRKEEEEEEEEVEGKEEEQERQRREEQILMLGSQNSLQTAVMVRVGTEEDDDEEEEEQEKVKDEERKNNEEKEQTSEKPHQELEVEAEQGTIINYSYELPDETNKHNQVVSVNNLSTPPQSPASTPTPSSPSPPSPPQVADGSHFMCV
ncbi:pleckstrin homology domain-containing family A member 5 isoform X2 [Alosa sapidissima]|uniref:pleckstrin homology domain-containing family A member 5 isoform X2 n=1 Tax=Alosa sapidissima TaxID=34773 RepID=UPI001C0A461E|nr:pleckstrin homology domain-containing family A member 5 isoform X2 [Alosa sapidissima]